MSKNDEVVDPIVLAAMIEDPNEDEDIKKLRKDILETDETVPPKSGKPTEEEDEDDDEDEPDDKKGKKSDDSDEDDKDEDQDDEKKGNKKPIEAQDDPEDEDDEEDTPKTRKEKRQQRQEDFLASIRKDSRRSSSRPNIPEYNPLDYSTVPKDKDGNEIEYKPEDLAQDREMYGAVSFAKGAQATREAAEQDAFWRDTENESKILAYDPELKFLNETLPDGSKNPDFDPDKTEEVNAMYLQLCGAETYQATNAQGQPLFNRNTGQPIMMIRVRDTGISYEKFARGYVKRMKSWAEDLAEDRVDESRDNIIKQKKNQGVRPGGGKRKSLGAISQGDVSRMSDEEFEKNEDAINSQIDAMLGL